ncbi:M28 family metallopeptidase [Antrihabitans sp. YC2-6]|uniref:M28 family metallopeptidase n=1 Tax=Antrihabitans sp. YC2-6 TaxID=2799498 RepID=UPI0018F58B3F|nr:M28 family metallopeptidase [Antrihabitans sp. YC2-6]MBJ8348566.1 M28 family peptidase [Antrihabitans sp. YC2-6]
MRSALRLSAALVAVALVGSACGSGSTDESNELSPETFASSIGIDAVVGHLAALERIAKEHDGNRAAGTAGYDASVDYVTDQLKALGFDVQTPEFTFATYETRSDSLAAGDKTFEVTPLEFSPSTPPEGVRGRLVAVPADDSPGCEESDYDGLDVAGAIVVVPRGTCEFVQKQRIAADRGAAAVLVIFAHNAEGGSTLGAPEAAKIPVARINDTELLGLGAAGGDLTLKIDAETVWQTSRNVIAQTKTGSPDNVVMVGAHLDSVPEGPGINDNGSGSAALLEIAAQLGSSPEIENAVRFAWWGGEELGLLGSTDYVEKLTEEQSDDIALYLNFDMLGSPNPAYFTYDGDNSDGEGEAEGPQGSAEIERTFNEYFDEHGISPEGSDFSGRSDYGPFIEHKIPAGGVFSGAEGDKTPEQAAKWGGAADKPYDENYHGPGDTLANINRDALELNAAAAAWGVATYALDITGPDGVPVGTDRAAARGEDE